MRRVWHKIRTHASQIRISGYDITNRCNLRCEGCFFFEGELSAHYSSDKSEAEYRAFFRSEVQRGITYPHFAGAEPALVQNRLRVAAEFWRNGLVYTNGTLRIDEEIPFMLHISVWGGEKKDQELRGGQILRKAIRNYQGDARAVFMYTVNPQNISDIPEVVTRLSDAGLRISFNHYSASRQYKRKVLSRDKRDSRTFRLSTAENNLIFSPNDLLKAKETIGRAMADFPQTVIFSAHYNDFVHRSGPLFDIDPDTGMARNCVILNIPYHRQHHTDFSFSDSECCVANIDCTECRHYVSIYTLLMSKMKEAMKDEARFASWLDVYNTWCRLHFVGWDNLPDHE
ncbi:MAG: hypothetical protein OHK0011_14800 [Turneriella sp.]